MKGMSTHGCSSARSIVLAMVAAGCIGCMCVLGVAQALTATSRAAVRQRGAAGLSHCEQGLNGYCPKPPLYFRGGKGVQHKPWLFPIFWGSSWNTKGAMLKAQIVKMYSDFSGSAYQGILTQYFDSKGHIESTIKVVQPYVDERVTAPTEVSEATLKTEVAEAIAANSWPSAFDGQYIVLTAPGSTYHSTLREKGVCAYHNKTGTAELSYSYVPYFGESPYLVCVTANNVNASTMAAASHEYAESATDPFLATSEAAWNSKGNEKYEISDICETGIDELPDGSWVQGQWDNFKNECALSDASPAYVYAIGEPAEAQSTTATLRGFINPEDIETTYYFDYGTTPSYGTDTPEVNEMANWTTKPFSQMISSLTPNTAYYYVLVGKNSTGTAKSLQEKFKTPSMFESKQDEGNDKILKFGELKVAGAVVTCAASEIKGQWHIATNAQIKQTQKEATKGLDLLLQVKNWGKCSAKIGKEAFGAEIKECDIRIVQVESEIGYGGVVSPCFVKIGTEGKEALCELQIPAGMETEAESDEGINVGLKEATFNKTAPLILKVNLATGGLGGAEGEGIFVQQIGKHLLCPVLKTTEEAELVGMEVEAEGVESP